MTSSSGSPGTPGGPGSAPPAQVTYAGTVQQTDEAIAQAQVAGGSVVRGFVGAMLLPDEEAAAMANAQRQTSQYAASRVQGLGREIKTQSGPHTGGHNYMAYQPDELHQMVNSNADPSDVNTQGHTFNDVGNDFADMAAQLDKATSTASASWQGEAAEGGAAFTTAMSSWHGSTAQGAQYAGTQLFEQSQALDQARTNMPPPMAMPTTADVQKALLSYNPFDSSSIGALQNLANQAKAATANHQTMARVAQQYDSQLGTSATLPEFSAPSQFSPNPPAGTSNAASGGASGSGSASRASALPSGGRSAGAVGRSGSVAGNSGGGGHNVPPSPVAVGQGTSGQGPAGQGSTTTQGATGTYPPGGQNQLGGPQPPYSGGPGGPGGGNSGGLSGMPLGGGPLGGGFGPGGGGANARGGGSGFGPVGSGSASSGGSAQPGPRSAAGAASAEESAVESGAAGVRGASGAPAGGMGAGRGKRGEDSEHKRADYLLESDPEGLFGSDEKTIPPVIGL